MTLRLTQKSGDAGGSGFTLIEVLVVVTLLSIVMAVVAADGGLLLSFQFSTVKPSVLIVALS